MYIYSQVYIIVIRECELYNILDLDVNIYKIFVTNLLIKYLKKKFLLVIKNPCPCQYSLFGVYLFLIWSDFLSLWLFKNSPRSIIMFYFLFDFIYFFKKIIMFLSLVSSFAIYFLIPLLHQME